MPLSLSVFGDSVLFLIRRLTLRAAAAFSRKSQKSGKSSSRRATIWSAAEALEVRQFLSATYYVATTGSDSNKGTSSAPFRTIQHAASIAGPGDTVDIYGGTYNETITPARSGSAGAPITFQAVAGQKVIVDGAQAITGWTHYSGSIYVANDPYNLGFGYNQVFDNGQAMIYAQWPNTSLNLSNPTVAYAQSGSGGTLIDSALASSGVNWTGATIHIVSGEQWVAQTATVTSDSGNKLTFSLAATGNPDSGVQVGNPFYLTGKFQALNAADEWYLDGTKLYFWAPNGGAPTNVQVKARQYGFVLSGRNYININNINLFGCSVIANGSSHVTLNSITDQYVSQFLTLPNGWKTPSNTGIVLNGSSNTIENSNIAYSAGDGILLLGSGNSARNNIVTGCDYDANDNAGIRAGGSGDVISGNLVYNCGRDGIKFSGATSTQITGNTVHDVMLQTTDGGGIYTYGTSGAGSLIANNRVYNVKSGGWGAAGLYLDNGSHGYTVSGNTVSNSNIGIKMNPPSYNNTIENNTLLGNMQSVASYGSEDMSGSKFINNIFDNVLMIKGAVAMSNNKTVSASYTPSSAAISAPAVPAPPTVGSGVVGTTTPPSPTPTPTPTPTSPTPTPTPSSPSPTPTATTTLTLKDSADAYVQNGSAAATHFGSAKQLLVKQAGAPYQRISYLTFNLTGLKSTSPIANATLKLFGGLENGNNSSFKVDVLAVPTTTWSETAITYKNAPARGAVVAAGVVPTETQKWYNFDLTSYLKQQVAAGKTQVTLALVGTASTTQIAAFASRESGADAPQLVVTE